MLNDGTVSWPESTSVVFIAGNRLGASIDAPIRYKVGLVEVESTVDVWAGDMKVRKVFERLFHSSDCASIGPR